MFSFYSNFHSWQFFLGSNFWSVVVHSVDFRQMVSHTCDLLGVEVENNFCQYCYVNGRNNQSSVVGIYRGSYKSHGTSLDLLEGKPATTESMDFCDEAIRQVNFFNFCFNWQLNKTITQTCCIGVDHKVEEQNVVDYQRLSVLKPIK